MCACGGMVGQSLSSKRLKCTMNPNAQDVPANTISCHKSDPKSKHSAASTGANIDTSNAKTAIVSSSASSSSSSSSSPSLKLGWHVVCAEGKYPSPEQRQKWIECLYEIYRHVEAVYMAVKSIRRGRKANVMGVLFHV